MADENRTPEYNDSRIDRTLLSPEAEQKLAVSLRSCGSNPYLPYLRDLWELGSNPRHIIELLSEHAALSSDSRILDRAAARERSVLCWRKNSGAGLKASIFSPNLSITRLVKP